MKQVLSLFSGCGGMDLGLEGDFSSLGAYYAATGFQTVFANDIRQDAYRAWCEFFAKRGRSFETYHLGSIVELVERYQAGELGIFPSNIDVVTGGFPCQDFSVAGKRRGFASKRNHDGKLLAQDEPSVATRGQLYMWMRDVVSLTMPKLFIAENVKGLVNLGDAKEIIERDFSQAGGDGYLVLKARVLNAADYGIPQARERVIFVGLRKSALTKEALASLASGELSDYYDPYPKPTHGYTKSSIGLNPHVTCRKAFLGLSEPEYATDEAQKQYSKAKYMGKHCQGQTEVRLDDVGPTIRAEHHGNIEFRRLSHEHGGTHTEELAQGLPERRLTVRECARLQTFPDDYDFVFQSGVTGGSVAASSAYKIIGNAVPPVLAHHLAMRLNVVWERYFD